MAFTNLGSSLQQIMASATKVYLSKRNTMSLKDQPKKTMASSTTSLFTEKTILNLTIPSSQDGLTHSLGPMPAMMMILFLLRSSCKPDPRSDMTNPKAQLRRITVSSITLLSIERTISSLTIQSSLDGPTHSAGLTLVMMMTLFLPRPFCKPDLR